ncbi:alpha-2-macroglobulin [Uliginosibacterium sp. 31-16]|uniref:alpha-2-macroglobulin family protein n=1 Tax=Uliginosibacterium sp. 31-16 TaxID=3068315 RepID=UPI00273F6BE3|nr:alpha-2-macroglobulin [Uliginosibacterium sp. 31-16]MDP5237890.1 alpha-2-macroglobulin [Uliginosibacterium sp. 31-16]
MSASKKILVAAAAAVIGLAAAGGWWWKSHHASTSSAGGDAVIAQADGPFSATACQPRLFEDQPALAVVFSEPLERGQSFDKILQVVDLGRIDGGKDSSEESATSKIDTGKNAAQPGDKIVQGSWVIGDNPRVLVFPYIKPQRNYRIKVADSLKAASGARLAEARDCQVATEEMPPSYYFASKGTILPAKQNGGLPVVTVNVPEVDVQFLRVEPAQLPRFIETVVGSRSRPSDEESENNGEGEYEGDYCYDCYGSDNKKLQGQTYNWQLDKLRELSSSVYAGRFLTSDKQNARKVTHLPVESIKELQEPGIYIAVMSQPGRFRNDYQVTYFYVTDIGLHAHRNGQQMDVFATSLTSGKAIGDAEIEVIDANAKSLAKGKLDGDGHALLSGVADSAHLLLARRGKELAIVALQAPALDLSEFDIGGHLPRDAKLFLYSGRDLYRPGEKFEVSLLARDAAGHVLPPAPIQAMLKRPDGKNVATMSWSADSKIPGYVRRTISLPADAQTGRWSIELRADPAAKAADTVWTFQVEEFLPERMKLDLKTDKGPLTGTAEFSVKVQGDYLFGSPAAGNRLLGSVAVERAINPLASQWPGFIFGDFADDSRKGRSEMEETALDEQGRTSVAIPFDAKGARSPLNIRAALSLLESGGRPVVRSIERVWWPATQLIGVRPEFDSHVARENAPASFELIRVGTDGKLAPLNEAAFRLYREDRQYYWRFDDQKGWNSGFTETEELVQSGKVALKQRGKLALPVGWGRYRLEIADAQTGQTLRYRFYAGWNAQDAESVGNRPDRVQVKLEGAPVKPGDSVKLNIVPPHDGEALVVVEADKVLWTKRISVSTSGTSVTIPVDKSWNRADMYISTLVFRPGSQGDRVTPARALGLVHLPLQREDRRLKVQVTAPDKVLPEKKTTVKVKVDNIAGKQAIVTLSAVDVGILNITRFKTPDPFDFFFGKHRYAPELVDLYGKLIEKMEGDKGKLKWGGDAGMRDSKSMPKKVKLVDLFSGPVALNDKGEAEITLDIPDFNGTLRLMAVASTPDNYGAGDREMVVAAPIVAELAMPRFIAPGDQATIALDVTNLSGSPQEISIRLSAEDPLKIRDGERTVSLKDKQRSTLRFTAEPTDAYGLARIRLEVKGSGAKPVSIVRESALQVQPPIPLAREVRRAKIEADGSFKLDPTLADKYFKASSTVSVTVSNKPPLNVNSIVKGLLNYPYGCLEQTTSAAYPHIYIDEAAAKAMGFEGRTREQRAQFIEGAIGRIAGMQGAKGGFMLWGSGSYETWLTPYVTGFLMDARAQGFNVPDAMVKRSQEWMLATLQTAPNSFPSVPATLKPDEQGRYKYQDADLLRNGHQRFAEMAYLGFMLARDQKAPLATLRILHDQFRNRARSPLPLVHLSLALQMMGDSARAKVALEDAMTRHYGIQPEGSYYWGEWLGDYGSRTRDLALSYALLTQYKVKHPRVENLLFELADGLGNRSWLSTQERLSLFLAANAQGVGDAKAEWTAILKQGETAATLTSRSSEIRSISVAALAKGVSLDNKSGIPLFVEIETSGYPLKPPVPKNDVIELSRDWFNTDGSAWRGGPLKVGDMLIARVTATAKQAIEDGMIVDHIPAGLEVENLNLSQGPQAGEFTIGNVNVGQAMSDERIKHREYRDDRFVVAAKLGPQKLTLFYMLRVVTPGTFTVPASFAEDMYRPELRGVGSLPSPITVVDPKGTGK